MLAYRDILIFAAIAGCLAAAVLCLWSWSRSNGRFAVAGIATTVGFAAWNLTLDATKSTGFNVDTPIVPVTWQDVGSGVMAFTVTVLVLGLVTDHGEPARRIVSAAAVAGLVAMVFDVFVL